MKQVKLTITLATMLLALTCGITQNTAADKIGKINKDLKTVFDIQKKNNPYDLTGNDIKNLPSIQSGNNQNSPKQTNTNELKPGDVHPSAVYLDVDVFYPFNHGAAIVKKGTSTAMIDTKGKFIVPFNKYSFTSTFIVPPKLPFGGTLGHEVGRSTSDNGLFTTSDGKLINYKGEVLVESDMGSSSLTLDGQYAYKINHSQANKYTTIFYNKDGKKIIVQGQLINVNEGIGIFEEKLNSYRYRYKNLNDQLINSDVYDHAEPFSDGLALVGKRNEFGQMLYGFINISGKEVIPLKYTIKPGSFFKGLAKVFPKDVSEFKYAFINNKGTIVVKFTGREGVSDCSYIGDGLFLGTGSFMDSTGKRISYREFFESFGIKKDVKEQVYLATTHLFDDGKIRCTGIKDKHHVIGFVDRKSRKAIEPVFITAAGGGNTNTYFDNVSKLAFAKVLVGRDNSGKETFREGYINEDGIFMIVKGPESQW